MRSRPLRVPVVSSYDDQRRWMEHALAVVLDQWGSEAEQLLCEASSKYTLSTACSGTGGAETCDRSLRSAMRRFVGDVAQPPASILFCFYDSTCVSRLHETDTKQILITISAMWAIEKLEHSRAELHLIDPNMRVDLDM